jgi:hypothetical protein
MGSQLYDGNPRGPPLTQGTGFSNASKARKTLKLIKSKPNAYKQQVITTMYYRAKHHPHQTKKMRNAMKIFKSQMTKKRSKRTTRNYHS